jgi:hypothetical protein
MDTLSDPPTVAGPSIDRTNGFQRAWLGKSMRIDQTRSAEALISICVSTRCIDEGQTAVVDCQSKRDS